jgi:4-hydroxythreonine-4-phosphate dehydrogenase
VAGIGPELVVKAWCSSALQATCRPVVIGSSAVLERERRRQNVSTPIQTTTWEQWSAGGDDPSVIGVIEGSPADVADLTIGRVHAAAGRAAYDYLVCGIDAALAGRVDGIVTLPLHKEGLHAAGLAYPGHTEILAERTGSPEFGMMLYRRGLGVLHVTLHMSLREALKSISTPAIEEKIRLLDDMMRRLGVDCPRLAVSALNPHASDGGLFGDEEERIIRPAVHQIRLTGVDVAGPIPADTLFVRASQGEFDGVVAMYHDQGHIALKLLGWREAVNITVGLPIIRTSVAHGTAYDIVGGDRGDATSLLEAVRVASMLCRPGSTRKMK